MRLAVAGVVLEFLDALTTFLNITLGLGYEANPRISFVNEAPIWVFPIFLAQAAFLFGVGFLAHIDMRRGFMGAYYVMSLPVKGYLVHKVVVVANNVAVGAVGFQGLDYYVSEAVKMFMVMGGLAYGLLKARKYFKSRHAVEPCSIKRIK
jgi:hypothetical protein